MGVVFNILAFVLVLGIMVLVHELGHFLAAKFFDVRVEAFSIGFGPRLFGIRGKETDYKICILPLGGFVKMAGENPGEPTGDPREFVAKPRWQRIVIAFMGPAFNFVLAVVLLIGLFMVQYEKPAFWDEPAVIGFIREDSAAERAGVRVGDTVVAINDEPTPTWESVNLIEAPAANSTIQVTLLRAGDRRTLPVVLGIDEKYLMGDAGWAEEAPVRLGQTLPNSPAYHAGIQSGDMLLSINGESLRSFRQVPQLVQKLEGRPGRFEIERDGERRVLEIAPQAERSPEGEQIWRIGVQLEADYEMIETQLGFFTATREATNRTLSYGTLIFRFLRGLLERRMSPKSLEGPIGIARISGDAARSGVPQLIMFMSALSLNLGIFNLLPIPILDGGVITMLLLESVIRRDISLPVKERIVQVGFVFLMLLFAFVMYNDILKSFSPS
jgi:regulator of sigma E protease